MRPLRRHPVPAFIRQGPQPSGRGEHLQFFRIQKPMSIFIFLMVVQALVGACMVGVILIQKSEGGGLGMGGSPTGFMSARGAADFLTRATAVLATMFVVLSII